MILSFIILTLIATFAVYAFIQLSFVLYIGLTLAGGLVLISIWEETSVNFYVQSVFLLLFSVGQVIGFYLIPDKVNAGIFWILFTVFLFTMMKDWIIHFASYSDKKYVKPYVRSQTRRYGGVDEYEYKKYLEGVDALEHLKFYSIAVPYAIFNVIILWVYYVDGGFWFLPILSPLAILLCIVAFLISFKVRDIDPIGYHDNIRSFGDVFVAIGRYFKRLGTGFVDFITGIGSFFGSIFHRRPSYKKSYGSSRSYSSYSTKTKREKPAKSSYGSSYSYRSYSDGEFSVVMLILPIVFCLIVVVCAILENQSILSSNMGNLGEWVMNFFSERSQWFVLTGLVYENCLMQLEADSLMGILTYLPLLALCLALLALTVVLEIILSIAYFLLSLVLVILSIALSFVLVFVPGILAIATVIVTVLTFTGDKARSNKITSCVFLSLELVACVYYFIVLFSHSA